MTALHEEGSSQHKAHNEQKHCQEGIQCVRYRTPNCSYHHLLCLHACNPPFQSNFIVSTSWMNPNMRQSSGKKMLQQTAEHKKGTREVPRGERKQASKEMSTPNQNHTQFEKSKGSGYSEEERLPCWERDTQEHKSWKMLSSPKQNKKPYKDPLSLSLSLSFCSLASICHSWRQKATTQWDNNG